MNRWVIYSYFLSFFLSVFLSLSFCSSVFSPSLSHTLRLLLYYVVHIYGYVQHNIIRDGACEKERESIFINLKIYFMSNHSSLHRTLSISMHPVSLCYFDTGRMGDSNSPESYRLSRSIKNSFVTTQDLIHASEWKVSMESYYQWAINLISFEILYIIHSNFFVFRWFF